MTTCVIEYIVHFSECEYIYRIHIYSEYIMLLYALYILVRIQEAEDLIILVASWEGTGWLKGRAVFLKF